MSQNQIGTVGNVLCLLTTGIAAVAAAGAASGQCTPRWVEGFAGGGLGYGSPQAFAVFDDDGAGPDAPALFAGGWFTSAGGEDALRIAKWDGERWSALSPNSLNAQVYALAVFDDDGAGPHPAELVAGGAFLGHVLKWNGTVWTSLGSGIDGDVHALAVFDDDGPGPHGPALYAGGTFAHAGGASAMNVARWDGASWTPLGVGTTSTVRALASFDPDGAGPAPRELCAGGDFTFAGGLGALHVARWNGTSWSDLAGGTDGGVRALAEHDDDGAGPGAPALYVGGAFGNAGTTQASRIARWNGSSWSALAQGVDDAVDSLTEFDPDANGPLPPALYAGGDFTAAGGAGANHVARWEGASWSPLGAGLANSTQPGQPPSAPHAYALAGFDADGAGPRAPALFAGGIFTSAGQAVVENVAVWDGDSWSALGGGLNGTVWASTVFDDDGPGPHAPELVVGGDFTGAGGRSANRIASFDGASWSNLRAGMNGIVRALTVFDADGAGPALPALIAGGGFTAAGGPANGIARWDGSSWEPLGSGVTGPIAGVYSLAVFDDDGAGPNAPSLYAGGTFTIAGGVNASCIAKWDGAAWSEVGGGVSGGFPTNVRAMTVFDEDGPGALPSMLYVAGVFTNAGGAAIAGFARWDGSAWSEVPGTQSSVFPLALAAHDEDGAGPGLPALFVGGSFDAVGSLIVNGIARFDGSHWSALGSGVDDRVLALAVFDADGSGPGAAELYAAGQFATAGGAPASDVARWNGSSWSALSSGIGGPQYPYVATLAVYDDDGGGPDAASLYAGGRFASAGGISSSFIARRQGCGSTLTTFCAGDGAVAPCPCGNSGGSGRGCQNSAGTGGALLTPAGHAALTGDSWQLTSTGELTSALSIFLQGDVAVAPLVFGDGLRCVGGTLKRLYTKGASGGVASAPIGAEPPVSVRSAERGDPLVAGAVRHYQTYYRDANPSFCAAPVGSTFNISNGISAVWGP